jgi:hypothetical protein
MEQGWRSWHSGLVEPRDGQYEKASGLTLRSFGSLPWNLDSTELK